MRKIRFFIATLLVVAAVSAAVVSCKKEKQDSSLSSNTEQAVLSANNMDEYLVSFKNKLLLAQKGDETISLEQAQRDLSNLLNFDFGDANYATNVFHHDTLYSKLTTTSGEVDLSQLATTYQTILDQVRNAYYQVNLPEKSIYSIFCTFGESKEGLIDVIVILTIRAFDESTLGNTVSSLVDWRAGNRAGTCDDQLVGIWGAPEEVLDMLHNSMGQWGCANGGRVYFTEATYSIITSDLNLFPEMADPNAPRGSRLFFKYDLLNDIYNTCLPYSEIVYYYNQARQLADSLGNSFVPAVPSDHVVTEYRYITYLQYYAGHVGYWKLDIEHAKLNCTGSQPIID